MAIVVWSPWSRSRSSEATFVTATVATQNLEETVLAAGVLQASQQVSVGAQVSGEVKRLHVALGERVRAGQVIAEIDSLPQRNALLNAEAALANIQAQLRAQLATRTQAALALERQTQMRAADATSSADHEAARAALALATASAEALEAQIRQARITVDTARANVGYTRITTPIDGQVVAIVTPQGQTVNALQTAPTIVKIAQLDTMLVRAQISEADVTRVRPGQTARFTILGEPDRKYTATLRSIEPAPDSTAGEGATGGGSTGGTGAVYYGGVFAVPNPDGALRIAMTAQVQIVRSAVADALVVPLTALGPKGADGRHEVRVVDAEGRASPRRVAVGMRDGVNVQIVDGLARGERVVIGGGGGGGATMAGAASSSRRMDDKP